MISENFQRFFLLFASIFVLSEQLDCTKIAENDQVSGKILKIPNDSADPVELPANFSCLYSIKPPKMVYSRITVTNQLKNADDVIIVSDAQGKIKIVDRNSSASIEFYVFPETTTTINVTSKNENKNEISKFLLTISYLTLPNPSKIQLKTGQNLNYFSLNSVRNQPIQVEFSDKISLITARSGHRTDVFDNFFVIDGQIEDPKAIKRLVDYQTVNFNSTGNSLSLVCLDNSTSSFSSVILTPSADLRGFDTFSAVAVAVKSGQLTVRAAGGLKKAVVVVAHENDPQQLVLNSFTAPQDSTSTCHVTAITGSPNAVSKTLIDLNSGDFQSPQLFPFPYFSIIVENCDVSLQFQTAIPANYYKLSEPTSGFIFSPSFFNLAAPSLFNVTFEYTDGDVPGQFVVDVESVEAIQANAQLDIDIYDAKWAKTLSAVITGNQEGTRSRAFGTYLNVQMSGNGTARLRYQLTDSCFSGSGLPLALLLAVLISIF